MVLKLSEPCFLLNLPPMIKLLLSCSEVKVHATKGREVEGRLLVNWEFEIAAGRRCLGNGVAAQCSGQAARRNLHNDRRQQHVTSNHWLLCALHSWHLALPCGSVPGSPVGLRSPVPLWRCAKHLPPPPLLEGKEGGVQHTAGQRSGQLRHRLNKHS